MKPARTSKSPSYPIGTVAIYGPDNTRATKIVAAVFKRPHQPEADALHRWISHAGEIRNDPVIAVEIADFFKQHRVKQTSVSDRIMGCPHEEGKDYPMGRTCPHCPFWATIDRFTHEPIKPPAPTRSPEQILAELSVMRDTQPLAALESAEAHREALVEPLLQAVERGLANPAGLPEGGVLLFRYALYLLAKWRETRAYPLVVRWLSLPGDATVKLGAEAAVVDGKRILAAVFDGNFDPLLSLILNREANEFSRGTAVEALELLAAWAEVPRAAVEDRFLSLAREGLERHPGYVWNVFADTCSDMEATLVFPELRRACAENLISPQVLSPARLDKVEARPQNEWIEDLQDEFPPITNVVEATSWWACFKREGRLTAPQLAEYAREQAMRDEAERSEPVRNAPKPGRNDPCPCGSGKKYKKCCGA